MNISGIEYWASVANETFRYYQFCLCFLGQILFLASDSTMGIYLVMYCNVHNKLTLSLYLQLLQWHKCVCSSDI